MRALTLLLMQAVAFWPVGHWVYLRTRYDSEDRAELLAMLAATIFVVVRHAASRSGRVGPGAAPPGRALALPTALVVLYAVASPHLPAPGKALLAVSILAITAARLIVGMRSLVALWGLLLLALPIVPVLQFQLGYPLRSLTAALTAPLLRLGGLDVVPVGTCLQWSGNLIWVDAPCSGLRMSWSALFLLFTLACFLRLDNLRTLLAAVVTIVALVCANAFRAAALFYIETGLLDLPDWSHEAVGLAVHAMLAAGIVVAVQRLERAPPPAPSASQAP